MNRTYEIDYPDGLGLLDGASDMKRPDGIKLLTAAGMGCWQEEFLGGGYSGCGRWEEVYEDMFGKKFLDCPMWLQFRYDGLVTDVRNADEVVETTHGKVTYEDWCISETYRLNTKGPGFYKTVVSEKNRLCAVVRQ